MFGIEKRLGRALFVGALCVFGLLGSLSRLEAEELSQAEVAVIEKSFEWTMRARDLFAQGEYDAAEDLFRRVLALHRNSAFSSPLSEATALHNLAATIAQRGSLAEAKPMAELALTLRRENKGVDNAIVSSLRLLSSIEKELGYVKEARNHSRMAVELSFSGTDIDPKNLIRNVTSLAYLTAIDGDLDDAVAFINQVTPMLAELTAADQALVMGTVGRLSSMAGDLASAEKFYREAVRISSVLPVSDTWTYTDKAASLNNLGALMLRQGDLGSAGALFSRADITIRQSGLVTSDLYATILDGLGEVERARGDHSKAFELERQALDIRQKFLPEMHPEIGVSYSNLGLTLLYDRQPEAAIKALEKAVAIQTVSGDVLRYARAATNLSGALAAVGRGQEAVALASEVSIALDSVLPGQHPQKTTAILNEAWLLLATNHPEPAKDRSRIALSAFREESRRLGADAVVGYGQRRDDRRQILALVAALWETEREDGLNEAFEAAQWAQSSSAGQVARRVAARFAASDGEVATIARRKQDLVNQWRSVDQRYLSLVGSAGHDDARTLSLRNVAETLAQRIDELDQEITVRFPSYAALTQPKSVSVNEVQSLLAPHEALIFPVTTPDETYVFAITAEAATWMRSDMTESTLDAAVRQLRLDLDATGQLRSAAALSDEVEPEDPRFNRDTAYLLYQQLILPVVGVLGERNSLLTVQEGALSGLPLSVLVMSPDEDVPLQEVNWLAREFAVSTIPSVSGLQSMRQYKNPRRPTTTLAAFGDPEFSSAALSDGSQSQPQRLVGVADVSTLQKLPGTRREVRALADLLGADANSVFLGAAATETAVKNAPEVSDAAIVVFATHGLVAGEMIGLSEPALAFSQPAQWTEQDDGLLTASEVAKLDLSADWVILSACNTAASDGSPGGEGLSGLASAFFYAGARSLLVSHWPVRDDAAAWLTRVSVEAVTQDPNISPAEALRRSMVRLMESDALPGAAHPSVWAPFTVVGAGTALE